MTKYRFKTLEEFKEDGQWIDDSYSSSHRGYPEGWADCGAMNKYMGEDIPDIYNSEIEENTQFRIDGWVFNSSCDYVLNKEIDITEVMNELKQLNSLKTKEKMTTKTKNAVKKNPVGDKFVFMDKTVNILNVGFQTGKNVVLYGPGE